MFGEGIERQGDDRRRRGDGRAGSVAGQVPNANSVAYTGSQPARIRAEGNTGGAILNLCSLTSTRGIATAVPYGSSKAGLLGMTRALAVELAVHHIRVNAILPGWYETDLTRGLPATPLGEEIRRRTPAGRWGEPDDLVGTAVYLAAPASDFVTGAAIPVDGGYAVSDRLLHG